MHGETGDLRAFGMVGRLNVAAREDLDFFDGRAGLDCRDAAVINGDVLGEVARTADDQDAARDRVVFDRAARDVAVVERLQLTRVHRAAVDHRVVVDVDVGGDELIVVFDRGAARDGEGAALEGESVDVRARRDVQRTCRLGDVPRRRSRRDGQRAARERGGVDPRVGGDVDRARRLGEIRERGAAAEVAGEPEVEVVDHAVDRISVGVVGETAHGDVDVARDVEVVGERELAARFDLEVGELRVQILRELAARVDDRAADDRLSLILDAELTAVVDVDVADDRPTAPVEDAARDLYVGDHRARPLDDQRTARHSDIFAVDVIRAGGVGLRIELDLTGGERDIACSRSLAEIQIPGDVRGLDRPPARDLHRARRLGKVGERDATAEVAVDIEIEVPYRAVRGRDTGLQGIDEVDICTVGEVDVSQHREAVSQLQDPAGFDGEVDVRLSQIGSLPTETAGVNRHVDGTAAALILNPIFAAGIYFDAVHPTVRTDPVQQTAAADVNTGCGIVGDDHCTGITDADILDIPAAIFGVVDRAAGKNISVFDRPAVDIICHGPRVVII